jgi:hypothetical protein
MMRPMVIDRQVLPPWLTLPSSPAECSIDDVQIFHFKDVRAG